MIVAFTGHRPSRIDHRINQVVDAIGKFLEETKPEKIISGMAEGVDQLAAAWALRMGIPYIAAVPFVSHCRNYSSANYNKLIDGAAEVKIICEGDYAVWKYQKRNVWMVDKCDLLAAIYDGSQWNGTANCIKYAKQVGRDIRYLEWL